jgi:hypothetical protein
MGVPVDGASAMAADTDSLPVQRPARRRRLVAKVGSDRLSWDAVGLWVGSRIAVVLLAVAASYQSVAPRAQVPPFTTLWQRWDAEHLLEVARFGYFNPTHHYAHCCEIGFFPGQPLLVRLVHALGFGWYLSPLLVSAVSGLVAVAALARLAALEVPDRPEQQREVGRRAVLYLVLAPYAVFLFAGYTEAPFLAFATVGWLGARRGRWAVAGLGIAGAAFVRVTGLFLAAGLVVEYVVSRRRSGRPVLRPVGLWTLAPFISGGSYFLYLYLRTSDVLAWQRAQDGFGRGYTDPLSAFRNSYHIATAPHYESDWSWAWKAEIAAVLVGVALTVVLLWLRRYGEAVFVGLGVAVFTVSMLYYTAGRASLLWFPLWLLLARASLRRRWLHGALLSVSAPLMAAGVVAFTRGLWVN